LSPAVMGVCCGMIGGVVEKCWPMGSYDSKGRFGNECL
jgi:maltoporin